MHRSVPCPTCGHKLGPLNHKVIRRCNTCGRSSPRGFNYCGFCAAPLENTELRARIAEIAAPPGGWPSLASELVQLKFFVRQGQLEDADDLLLVLHQRHPGHPALIELNRPRPMQADEDVGALVDKVLASSADLSAKIPRRAAPKWAAPESTPRTDANKVVARKAPPKTKTRPKREPTKVYGDVHAAGLVAPNLAAPKPSRSGHTVAVDRLQPAQPFSADPAVKVKAPAIERGKKNAAAKPRRKRPVPPPDGAAPTRKRGTAFGEHILNRFGR